MIYDPYKRLIRFRKPSKPTPMPPGHGQFLRRLQFERDYINNRLKSTKYVPEQLSLEVMIASLEYIERR